MFRHHPMYMPQWFQGWDECLPAVFVFATHRAVLSYSSSLSKIHPPIVARCFWKERDPVLTSYELLDPIHPSNSLSYLKIQWGWGKGRRKRQHTFLEENIYLKKKITASKSGAKYIKNRKNIWIKEWQHTLLSIDST